MHPTTAVHNFSVSKAHKTQLRLSQKIIAEDHLPEKVNSIAGVDVAYTDKLAIGAAAVLDYVSLELLELQTATCEAKFPYIPTLLSFREIPPAVACIKKLKLKPDVLLVDGQGAAHPYGCGFASHLGLAIRKPTVGVAKSRLFGEPKTIAGQEFLFQKGQIIGAVVTTKKGAKPVYVSVGHLISLAKSVQELYCCAHSALRLPQLFQARLSAQH